VADKLSNLVTDGIITKKVREEIKKRGKKRIGKKKKIGTGGNPFSFILCTES
jgi:hypothetical protein